MKKILKAILAIIEGLLTIVVAIPVFIWKFIKFVLLIGIICTTFLKLPFWLAFYGWLVFLVSVMILSFWKSEKIKKIFR